MATIVCTVCKKPATFEDFMGCFVHDDQNVTDEHNVMRVVAFDAMPTAEGWAACDFGKTWNGWAVPFVTEEVRDAIATWCALHCDDGDSYPVAPEIRALQPQAEHEGLYEINLGLTFSWVA